MEQGGSHGSAWKSFVSRCCPNHWGDPPTNVHESVSPDLVYVPYDPSNLRTLTRPSLACGFKMFSCSVLPSYILQQKPSWVRVYSSASEAVLHLVSLCLRVYVSVHVRTVPA